MFVETACPYTALAGLEQNSVQQAGLELVLILTPGSQVLDYRYAPPRHGRVSFFLPPLLHLLWCVQLRVLLEVRGQPQVSLLRVTHSFSLLFVLRHDLSLEPELCLGLLSARITGTALECLASKIIFIYANNIYNPKMKLRKPDY